MISPAARQPDAWQLLVQAGLETGVSPLPEVWSAADRERFQKLSSPPHTLEQAEAAELQRLVEAQHTGLATLDRVTRAPRGRIPAMRSMEDMPQFGTIRRIAEVKLARAMLSALRHDWQAATEDLVECLGAGQIVAGRGATLIHYLVGLAIQEMSLSRMRWLAADAELPDEQRAALAAAMHNAADPVGDFAQALRTEWIDFSVPLILGEWKSEETQPPAAHLCWRKYPRRRKHPSGQTKRDVEIPSPRRSELLHLAEETFAQLTQPLPQTQSDWVSRAQTRIDDLKSAPSGGCDTFVDYVCRSRRKAKTRRRLPVDAQSAVEHCMYAESLQLAIDYSSKPFRSRFVYSANELALAILDHESRHGELGSLEALVTFEPSVSIPTDPFCGKPLLYDSRSRHIDVVRRGCPILDQREIQPVENPPIRLPGKTSIGM